MGWRAGWGALISGTFMLYVPLLVPMSREAQGMAAIAAVCALSWAVMVGLDA